MGTKKPLLNPLLKEMKNHAGAVRVANIGSIGEGSQGTVIVNGGMVGGSHVKELRLSGRVQNIAVINNQVFVNGKAVTDEDLGIDPNKEVISLVVNVHVEGNVDGDIDTQGSVTVKGNVGGSIDTQGSVHCGSVQGDVDTQGSVTVTGDVRGSINTMGRVSVTGDVHGDIETLGSVTR